MTLKALVTHNRQIDKVACYVSYYPHWQNPNAPEVEQVYQYASQLNQLKVPTLVFIGEHEQYQRMRPIFMGIDILKNNGVPAELIVYPGVGRGFDCFANVDNTIHSTPPCLFADCALPEP
jgi:carboxymethylenebutenolidase